MKLRQIFIAAMLTVTTGAAAQTVTWKNADKFPVFGKATDHTTARYERLPPEFEGVSRQGVWDLGHNSAGIYIRFRSNSTAIHARWTSTYGNHMNHQTLTGTRGLDLYALIDGQWRFVGSGRPNIGNKTTEQRLIGNMEPQMREYMLYLSLYDGVCALEIGVDEGAELLKPAVNSPNCNHPIVMYGTSILQGGCANRPGMAHTSIIERKLDMEVINLGFSGNAMLDMEIAYLMAGVEEPALYILDYAPNAWDYLIDSDGEKFFRIIRDAHPDVPVIFIEDPIFPHSIVDKTILKEVTLKNEAQKRLFTKLKKQGEKNIYYIGAEGMVGNDGESTVDGLHATDLGMMRYVDHVLPTIKKALKKSKVRK